MKTAINELLDFIENQEYNYLNKEQLDSCNKIKDKAIELLEKEKQQIIEAYNNANPHITQYIGEQYYTQTFKD